MGKHVLPDPHWAQECWPLYPTEVVFQCQPPALLKKTTATKQEEDKPLMEARELKVNMCKKENVHWYQRGRNMWNKPMDRTGAGEEKRILKGQQQSVQNNNLRRSIYSLTGVDELPHQAE